MQEKANSARVNFMVKKKDLHPTHLKELLRHGKVNSRAAPQSSADSSDPARRTNVAFLRQEASHAVGR